MWGETPAWFCPHHVAHVPTSPWERWHTHTHTHSWGPRFSWNKSTPSAASSELGPTVAEDGKGTMVEAQDFGVGPLAPHCNEVRNVLHLTSPYLRVWYSLVNCDSTLLQIATLWSLTVNKGSWIESFCFLFSEHVIKGQVGLLGDRLRI